MGLKEQSNLFAHLLLRDVACKRRRAVLFTQSKPKSKKVKSTGKKVKHLTHFIEIETQKACWGVLACVLCLNLSAARSNTGSSRQHVTVRIVGSATSHPSTRCIQTV